MQYFVAYPIRDAIKESRLRCRYRDEYHYQMRNYQTGTF